MHNTKSEVL